LLGSSGVPRSSNYSEATSDGVDAHGRSGQARRGRRSARAPAGTLARRWRRAARWGGTATRARHAACLPKPPHDPASPAERTPAAARFRPSGVCSPSRRAPGQRRLPDLVLFPSGDPEQRIATRLAFRPPEDDGSHGVIGSSSSDLPDTGTQFLTR
jgi:hypothetical protein